jgi:hypothetical protein
VIRTFLKIVPGLLFLAIATTAQAASIVTEWLEDALPAANEVAWEPTIGARFFAILHTAMYDAWAAYDPIAVGVVSGTVFRNQGGLANDANKREAISHAAYTVLRVMATQRKHALVERMMALGYDPDATTPPAEIGRRAALAVLAKFHEDGANEAGGFADTTGYTPQEADVPGAWQPIALLGKRQLPTTPHWGRVLPFALTRADQFRPPPPPTPGSNEWFRQIAVLIDTSAKLTDVQKAAVEFWNEWGSSPAPHLIELTKFVSNARDLRMDDDVKLFFIVSNALFDVSIATWEEKYAYDYVRPITAIHALGDAPIKAWRPQSLSSVLAYSTPAAAAAAGSVVVPAGVGDMRAADWEPYLPTPSFPSYVSGHSAFCAAWARLMELATGTSELNYKRTVKHLYVEQRELAEPVTLDYPTYNSAAKACGISRIWGGIHWPADDQHGQELGRKVGENAWDRAQQFILGTASPATAAFQALRAPFWFHHDEVPNHLAGFQAALALAIDLTPGAAGTWRSIALDPMPAGAYQLTVRVAATGDEPVRLKVAIEPSEGAGAEPVATTEAVIPATGSISVVMLRWRSDGTESFRVSLATRADRGSERLVVSGLDAVRVWAVAAGSPRYYEPSLIGRTDR